MRSQPSVWMRENKPTRPAKILDFDLPLRFRNREWTYSAAARISSKTKQHRKRMKSDYQAILYTLQMRDKARWDLGDALVAECGAPDPTCVSFAGPGGLRAAWRYLQENGYDYSIEELSKLRRVAYVFGKATRRFDISWEVHAEAGTPEMLEAIIDGIPKGTPLTKSYIAFIRKQSRRHQREAAKE